MNQEGFGELYFIYVTFNWNAFYDQLLTQLSKTWMDEVFNGIFSLNEESGHKIIFQFYLVSLFCSY